VLVKVKAACASIAQMTSMDNPRHNPPILRGQWQGGLRPSANPLYVMIQPASSRPRLVAAATARSISRLRPSGAISMSSAAAVVPPGEVTF
jgi:hypothetical protein